MKDFPANIKFKYPWRGYQQKVLSELESHMSDRHLHVVAPPGSGKTVLGLEVTIRIDKPTLILAPTLTIRNQWIQRFCELFLQVKEVPEWISTTVKKPAFLTVVTYQGLHAACSEKSSGSDNNISIIELLKSQGIGTIVLDEAHHLKKEWWDTLMKTKKALDPFIVALTATPPYDVTYTEWKRYIDLNGPIDTEISVPELIIEGDLCPHQDHVYFSLPTTDEYQKLNKFRENISHLFDNLSHSDILLKVLSEVPAWKDPENNLEWIYDNLKIYTSTLVLFNANDVEIPLIHFEVIGIDTSKEDKKSYKIPELSIEHMEILLRFFLFQGNSFFTSFEDEQETLKHKLRKYGVLEHNRVSLLYNNKIDKLLTSSNGKLKSIKSIVNIEHDDLKSNLRMVILSDYIRKEYLNSKNEQCETFTKIGIIPIFDSLRADNEKNIKIGVLTGSLIIIPTDALTKLYLLSAKSKLEENEIYHEKYFDTHLIIKCSEKSRNKLTHIITQLFEEGEIEVLIGTKSLLGEGWDAPAINSLIMASFVGSFVLSNQMRGRAIRTQKNNPSKTSNIWHLVCIDPTIKNGGTDIDILKRRFKSFVGISNSEEPTIENGLQRLNIESEHYDRHIVDNINTTTSTYALEREQLYERWQKAIQSGGGLIEEIRIPFQNEEKTSFTGLKRLYWKKTIAYLLTDLVMILSAFGLEVIEVFLRNARHMRSLQHVIKFLIGACVLGLVFSGKQTYNTLKIYLKYRDISKDIAQIGNALLESLIKNGSIKTSREHLSVIAYSDKTGAAYAYLKGGSTFEQSLFVSNLQEVIDVIGNPRYIIVRKNKVFASFIKKDYHAVPESLGRNKEYAEYFHQKWSEIVGPNSLVYTRTIEGRKQLLNARVNALSSQFNEDWQSEQISKWK